MRFLEAVGFMASSDVSWIGVGIVLVVIVVLAVVAIAGYRKKTQ